MLYTKKKLVATFELNSNFKLTYRKIPVKLALLTETNILNYMAAFAKWLLYSFLFSIIRYR